MESHGFINAEAAAPAQEAGYRAIFDALGDAVLVVDAATGEIREVNQKMCDLFGYSPEEARGLNVRDIDSDGRFPLEAGPEAPEQFPELLEWQVKDRSGRQFQVEARLNRTVLQGREQVCAVLREISGRQPMAGRKSLQGQWNLLHNFFAATPDLLVLKDRNSVYQVVNPAFCRYLGKAEEEIIGKTDFDLFPLVEAEIYRRDDLRVMETGTPLVQDEAVTGAMGREWLQVVKAPVFDETGRTIGVLCSVRDISKRKEMEEALRASEERLRAIVEDQTELVCRHLTDTTITFVNEALCRYFGKSRQELLGQSFLGSIPEEDRGPLLEALRGLSPDHPIVVLEQRVFNAHGEIRWQQWTNRGIFDAQGRLLEHQAVGRDITERKLAEEALLASEANYRTIFEAVNDGITVVDLETGNFLDVNQKWCQMSGFSPEEARGLNVAALCLDETPYSASDAMRWIMEASKEKPQLFEFMAKTKEGRRHWVEINLKRAIIGGRERLLTAVRDISQRKQVEEALRISEENYRTIFNSAIDGIAVVDMDTGKFLDANQQALEMSGYTLEEVRNSNFELFCLDEPPYTLKDAWNWHRKAIEAGLQSFEWKARDKKGRVQWVDLTLKRTVIGGRECILANIRDIGERKRTEEGLRASEAKYRNLVEQIPVITFIAALDDVSSPIYISPQIKAILGFTPEEWLADRDMFKKQLHPEDRDRVLTDLLLSYASGGPFAAEYRFLSKTGRVVWVRDESRAVYDSEGRPLFMQGVVLDITKRKKTEEALLEANNKLKALVQASPLAIVGLDLQGRVTSWNPAAEQIFGWRENEVMGRSHPIIPEEQGEEFKHLWQRMLRNESFMGLELRRRKKDGSPVDVSLSTAPLYDAAGHHAGAIGVFEDITTRKRTAEALRESEARFRAMFEGAPIGIALVDLNRKTLEGNPALREMGGYNEAELRHIKGVEVTHPDDWEVDNALFTDLLVGKRNRFQKETRYRHKQGHWVWARLSASLVRDAAGQPQFAISMVEDITERRRAQEAADEIRRQQQAILSNIPDIAWLKDRESRLIAVNEPYCQARRLPPQDLMGKTDFDIWPPDLATKYWTDDQEVMRTGKRKRVEEPLAGKDGSSFWVETIKTPIFNDRREVIGTAGIARDITERRRMEEALRKVSRALKAVTECDQALLRATNEAELLSEVCRIIMEVGGYRMAWVGFAQPDEGKSVRPMAHKGFEEGYMQTLRVSWADVERGRGPVGTAIRTGKPAIIRDTKTDPRFAPWRDEAFKRGYASVLALPLGDPQTFGALAIYAIEPNAFDDEEINLLIGLANDLAYGIRALRAGAERQRAEEALQDSEQKLRLLTSQLLTFQEKERRRVSRELHDELGQALTVLKIHLVAIENKLHRDQQELKVNCEYLLGFVDAVIENVRRLSWDLSPSSLEDLGLSSSLKYLVQETCRNNRMLQTMAVDEIDNLFSPEAEINIYRIFQESLTNIVRHADASRIDVEIKKQEDCVSFLIKDDGKGFDLKKARSRPLGKRSLGLTMMNERALMTGGTLNIWSRKGKGTGITLTILIQTQG